MDWRAFFTWVPSWVPFIGCNSERSIAVAISGFESMKVKLQCGIEKANTEKTKSREKIAELDKKIAEQKAKAKVADKAIKRANTVIKNIDKFVGDFEDAMEDLEEVA